MQLLERSVGVHWQLSIDCEFACMQVMEGSEGKIQEDNLELLEGASIKPDWQVSRQKYQSGKDYLLVCLFGFLMVCFWSECT